MALWGVPLIVTGLFPDEVIVIAAVGTMGAANALVDVGFFRVLARLVPDGILGRALTVAESLCTLGLALGSILGLVTISALGTRASLVAVGVLAPVTVLAVRPALARMDAALVRRDEEIAALKHVAMLGPLPVAAVDRLAAHLERVTAQAGDVLVSQGDRGDQFVQTMTAGQGFGEIALLRDVPRAVTVRARTLVELFALERRHFVPTLTAYRAAVEEADRTVDAYLAPGRRRRPQRRRVD